jgi:hypothetical protein
MSKIFLKVLKMPLFQFCQMQERSRYKWTKRGNSSEERYNPCFLLVYLVCSPRMAQVGPCGDRLRCLDIAVFFNPFENASKFGGKVACQNQVVSQIFSNPISFH